MNAPVLVNFDHRLPVELHCDAFKLGIEAVMMHKIENETHPVWFLSRLMTDCEKRYSTTEEEALAIVWALEKLCHFRSGIKFTIYTDHKALCWMKSKKDMPDRLARWVL